MSLTLFAFGRLQPECSRGHAQTKLLQNVKGSLIDG